jgi:hypothetical protein
MKRSGIAVPGYRFDKDGDLVRKPSYRSVSQKIGAKAKADRQEKAWRKCSKAARNRGFKDAR